MTEKLPVRFEGTVQKPVAEVFDAIVDDERMAKYFFSRASGPIEEGRILTWHFDDAGAHLQVTVTSVEKDKRIVFHWGASGKDTEVEMLFDETAEGTRLRISESAFSLEKKGPMRALGQMSAWTDFFDSLKAYLVFGIDLRRGDDMRPRLPIVLPPPAAPLATPLRDAALAIAGVVLGIILGGAAMYYYLGHARAVAQAPFIPAPFATTTVATSSATTSDGTAH